MERKEAFDLVKKSVGTKNLVKHMLAAEACMRKLAKYFNEDDEIWGLAGLLHDIDYEETKNNFELHGVASADLLKEKGVTPEVISAVKAHAGKIEAKNRIEKALYSVDPLTGLIVASALMHPSKKISRIDTRFVLNRFKEKRFAAGADRDQIRLCEELGLSLEKFIEICLSAMQEIEEELEL